MIHRAIDNMNPTGFGHIEGYENLIDLPKRATHSSSGYDFFLAEDVVIKKGEVTIIPLGVKCKMKHGQELLLFSRSSLGKLGLITLTEKIDKDYYGNETNDGHIMYCCTSLFQDIELKKGDRICQGTVYNFEKLDRDNCGKDIRMGGYGSTGK